MYRRRFLIQRWSAPLCALVLSAGCGADSTDNGPQHGATSTGTSTGSGSPSATTGPSTTVAGTSGTTSDATSTSGSGPSTSGSSGPSTSGAGGASGTGGASMSGTGGARPDASVGSGGTGGGIRDSGSAPCDASVPGFPGFCDNRVRTLPPTGNATIDSLLKMTPEACKTKLSGDYNLDSDPMDPDKGVKAAICGLSGAVYWVADMDIDCDGRATPGKCPGPDMSYQPDTALHGKNGALAAAVTPYVVIPNNFSAQGLNPGTVVAVIYGTKLQFAVFGDTGPATIIGEASYATAEKLGIPPSPLDGGVLGRTVTYIAFTGTGTVPSDVEDQAATKTLGDQLVTKLIANNP